MAVHAPAPEFHRVGGHKRGRVRVLRHGGDHFDDSLPTRVRRGNEEISQRAVMRLAVGKTDGFQTCEPRRFQDFIPMNLRRQAGCIGIQLPRRNVSQRVKKVSGIKPAVTQGLAMELGKPIRGEKRIAA